MTEAQKTEAQKTEAEKTEAEKTEAEKTETVVFCEGFHDRAFWKGLLTRHGFVKKESDPWGKPLKGKGIHGWQSARAGFVRIIPCKGDRAEVFTELRVITKGLATRHARLLIANIDADDNALVDHQRAFLECVRRATENVPDVVLTESPPSRLVVTVRGFSTEVELLVWSSVEDERPGVPAQSCLEKLVCASITDAYPDRAEPVKRWLDSRPSPPPCSPKEYSMSYMAGWRAEDGSEFFFEHLWQDPAIAAHLEERLRANDAWASIQRLVGP